MLRRSLLSKSPPIPGLTQDIKWKYNRRYPYLISFHQLPWNTVDAGSEKAHKLLAPHYKRLLELACTRTNLLSKFILDSHPAIGSTDSAHQLLPGLVYGIPLAGYPSDLPSNLPRSQMTLGSIEQNEKDEKDWMPSWAPKSWTAHRVSDPISLGHYGPIDHHVARVQAVFELKSPDLRLLCNTCFLQLPHKSRNVDKFSIFGQLQAQSDIAVLALFHYYRPNRPPSELCKPFEKYYSPATDLSILDELSSGWRETQDTRPLDERPVQPMAPYVPPVTPQYGLPDREAQLPGDCFGHRDRQWGHRW